MNRPGSSRSAPCQCTMTDPDDRELSERDRKALEKRLYASRSRLEVGDDLKEALGRRLKITCSPLTLRCLGVSPKFPDLINYRSSHKNPEPMSATSLSDVHRDTLNSVSRFILRPYLSRVSRFCYSTPDYVRIQNIAATMVGAGEQACSLHSYNLLSARPPCAVSSFA